VGVKNVGGEETKLLGENNSLRLSPIESKGRFLALFAIFSADQVPQLQKIGLMVQNCLLF
jgi:hypothetical protein